MGKTEKKAHQGRRAPRTHVDSALPCSDKECEELDPRARCPHCMRTAPVSAFRPREDRFRHPDRFICPACGSKVASSDYFETARRIESERSDAADAARPVLRRIEALEAARERARMRPWRSVLELGARAYRALNRGVLERDGRARAGARVLPDLKRSCYHLSSWFSLTGIPASHRGSRSLRPWTLRPEIVSGGLAVLPGNASSTTRGIQAEWLVYHALEQAMAASELPAEAALCPNIYLANPNACEHDRCLSQASGLRAERDAFRGLRPLYSQIDCLLLTAHAVYVIEVKSRLGDIEVRPGCVPRQTTPAGRTVGLARDVRQCENHASAFATGFPEIPYDRIFELTVYAHCDSFSSERTGFEDNVLVSVCDADGGPFTAAIAEQERKLAADEPLWTPAELEELAVSLRSRFGDVTGKKKQLHIERLGLLDHARRIGA